MKLIEPAEPCETAKMRMEPAAPEPMPQEPVLTGKKPLPSNAISWEKQFSIWLLIAFLSVASYCMISRFCVSTVQVSGRSMVPTLQDGERYLLNRLSFLYRDPLPGEVVVIRDPGHSDMAVKRIVAGPSDTISFTAGKVLVNGKQLNETYLAPGTQTILPDANHKEVHLGKDQYFMLGDNRAGSEDSRYYGPITRAQIVGPLVR